MQKRSHRSRRGLTLPELVIAAGIMTGVFFVLLNFQRFSLLVWQDNMTKYETQRAASVGMQKMAESMREARSVIAAQSSDTRLTLQMPAYNSDGSLILPLQNGSVISYYLSDTGGSTQINGGTILWRSVDGTPDQSWSLRYGVGKVILKPGGLRFSYQPDMEEAEAVVVTFEARNQVGTNVGTFVTSQEIMLRNRGL